MPPAPSLRFRRANPPPPPDAPLRRFSRGHSRCAGSSAPVLGAPNVESERAAYRRSSGPASFHLVPVGLSSHSGTPRFMQRRLEAGQGAQGPDADPARKPQPAHAHVQRRCPACIGHAPKRCGSLGRADGVKCSGEQRGASRGSPGRPFQRRQARSRSAPAPEPLGPGLRSRLGLVPRPRTAQRGKSEGDRNPPGRGGGIAPGPSAEVCRKPQRRGSPPRGSSTGRRRCHGGWPSDTLPLDRGGRCLECLTARNQPLRQAGEGLCPYGRFVVTEGGYFHAGRS